MKSTVIFVLALIAGSIFGATIFGPVSYYRTTGRPNVYDTTFIAYDTTVACTLIVLNGDESGEHRLSSAAVELNGVEIISESDFNPHRYRIVRVVSLRRENSLHLRLRSSPGSYLSLSIHRPCDAFISLSVDTVLGDSASFSVVAGGWGSLRYSFDFDGDGTYDTTTTATTISHTYAEPDTYLVIAKVEDDIGCEKVDSEKVVVEGYVFEAESLWSYDFSSLGLNHFDKAYPLISDNEKSIIVKTWSWVVMFHRGRFIAVYDSAVNDGVISHNGDYALIVRSSEELEGGNSDFDFVDTLGNILWNSSSINAPIPYVKPFISDNDSLIGIYDGGWIGNDDGIVISMFFNSVSNRAAILSRDGIILDTLSNVREEAMMQGKFRWDMKYFAQMSISGKEMFIYDKHLDLINTVSPVFEMPPDTEVSYFTIPVYYFSREDNHIYAYWSYSTLPPPAKDDFWNTHPDTGVTIQAVCIDSIGNVLWRRETYNIYVNDFSMSHSGKYMIGYSRRDDFDKPPIAQVALWLTQTNECLWKRNFPEAIGDSLEYAVMYEHPETNHTLLKIVFTDTSSYFHPDGSNTDIDDMEISILWRNPGYGFKRIDNTISIYKVRW